MACPCPRSIPSLQESKIPRRRRVKLKAGGQEGHRARKSPTVWHKQRLPSPGSSEERKLCRYSTLIRTHTGHKAKPKGEKHELVSYFYNLK
jgi:hypothetical protein